MDGLGRWVGGLFIMRMEPRRIITSQGARVMEMVAIWRREMRMDGECCLVGPGVGSVVEGPHMVMERESR